eukprot:3656420-Prymnesium_polylepis.1
MCQWQSFYAIFGFTSSIWMNDVITAELHRLALCASAVCTTYLHPAQQQANQLPHRVCVCLRAFAFVQHHLVWPVKHGSYRGVACLPMPYSLGSEIFFWSVIANLVSCATDAYDAAAVSGERAGCPSYAHRS